jgi:small subunit ribosomal protein S15
MISQQLKAEITKRFAKNPKDVGSTEVQFAVLTKRIEEVTEHLKNNNKDEHARRGLLQMVGKRKRMLKYLKANDFESYAKLIKDLGIRK